MKGGKERKCGKEMKEAQKDHDRTWGYPEGDHEETEGNQRSHKSSLVFAMKRLVSWGHARSHQMQHPDRYGGVRRTCAVMFGDGRLEYVIKQGRP